MKIYSYIFIAGIVFSQTIQANQLMRFGTMLVRAAQTGMQSFRSELATVKKQPSIQAQDVASEARPQILNLDNKQNVAPIVRDILEATSGKGSPVTINIIDAKGNRGNIGSTFVKTTTSTNKTEQKIDGSFNQETKSSSGTYHEGHLVGVSAITLAIVEFVHYMAR